MKDVKIDEFELGLKLAVPNHETNLFAIVPNTYCKEQRKFLNKLYIWDDSKKNIDKTLETDSEIVNLFFTLKKWFVVHTVDQIIAFNQSNEYSKIVIYDKTKFKQSLMTVFEEYFVFGFVREDSDKVHLMVF